VRRPRKSQGLGGKAPSLLQREPACYYAAAMQCKSWAARRANCSSQVALAAALAAAVALVSPKLRAETIIKQPGNHYMYAVEFEPHLLLGWANVNTNDPFPHGFDFNHNAGFGPGMRLSIPLVDNGFVKSINNNVALGLGIDWAHYGTNSNVVWVPVVMQWNFFLTDVVTVFGEPGIAIRAASGGNQTHWHADGVLQLGAKFMFSRNVGLTLRAGYPYFSLGLSLMF
jgi:hypothetical protein